MLWGGGFTQMEFPLLLWPHVPLEVNSEKWVKNCPLATGPIIIYRLCLIQSGDNIRNHQIQALPLFPQIFEIICPIRYIWRISSEWKHICHSVKKSMSFGHTMQCLALSWIKWKENFCYFLHSSLIKTKWKDCLIRSTRRRGEVVASGKWITVGLNDDASILTETWSPAIWSNPRTSNVGTPL